MLCRFTKIANFLCFFICNSTTKLNTIYCILNIWQYSNICHGILWVHVCTLTIIISCGSHKCKKCRSKIWHFHVYPLFCTLYNHMAILFQSVDVFIFYMTVKVSHNFQSRTVKILPHETLWSYCINQSCMKNCPRAMKTVCSTDSIS